MAYLHFLLVTQCVCLTWSMFCTPEQIQAIQGFCKCVNDGIMCNTSTIVLNGQDVDFLNYLVGNYSSIERIDVSDYGPGLIISTTLFTRFPKLIHLRVHHSNVVTIAPGAFSNLSDLRILEITGNPSLTYDTITAGLKYMNSPLLYMFNISGNHNAEDLPLAQLHYEMFGQLSSSSLRVLDISWSRLTFIQAPFPLLPHLEILNMSGTYLIGNGKCFASLLLLNNITLIALDYWPIFPRGYDSIVPWEEPSGIYKRSSEDSCQEFDLLLQEVFSENGCLHKLPEKLTTLIFRNIYLDSIFLNAADFCVEHNNILNLISTRSKFSKQLGVFGGLHQLKLFDMSFPDNADKSFPGSMIKPGMFHDMPSLMTIRVPGFRLHQMSTYDFQNLFVNNSNLTNLDVSFNDLAILPFETFIDNRFIEVLNVSNNKIREFDVDLTNCDGIQMVDLSNNKLNKIDVGVTRCLLSFNSSIVVYLQGNALLCECHLLKFFRSENILFDHPECIFNNERKSLDDMTLEFVEDVCSNRIHRSMSISVIVGITMCCVVVWTVLVIGVVVRRRMRSSKPDQQPTPISVVIPISSTDSQTRNPEFVVFLAYSHHDSEFAIGKIHANLNKKLKSRLPNRDPKKLFILYDQHFVVGSDIDEQCENAIMKSHVTVAVITKHFLDSSFCDLEIKMALASKVPLIPLFISKCEPDKLKGFMKVLYNEKVRLLWPDATGRKLAQVLKDENEVLDTLCAHIMAYVEQNSEQNEVIPEEQKLISLKQIHHTTREEI